MAVREDAVSTIKIGNDQRDLREADPSWITSEIVGRRKDGQAVCVFVQINESGANLPLMSQACRSAHGRGGGRAPNALETAIIDLWKSLGLDSGEVEPGPVNAFVRRVLQML